MNDNLSRNENTSLPDLNHLQLLNLLLNGNSKIIHSYVQNNKISDKMLLELASKTKIDSLPEETALLIANLAVTPEIVLEQLILCKSQRVWEALSANPLLKAKGLAKINKRAIQAALPATDRIFDLLIAHPHADRKLLQDISYYFYGDMDSAEKQLMAKNPLLAPKELLLLSVDNDPKVRFSVLQNPNSLITIFSKDENLELRLALLEDNRCTPKIVTELSFDKDVRIRLAVASSTNAPLSALNLLSKDKALEVRVAVAQNPNCSSELLHNLAATKNIKMQVAVMGNRNVTPEILQRITDNKHVMLWLTQPQKLELTSEIIQNCPKDENTSLKLAIAVNPRCTTDLFTILANDLSQEIRVAVAQNSSCDLKILHKLASDACIPVRLAAANNPNASVASLNQLAVDKDPYVKEAATKNIRSGIKQVEEQKRSSGFPDCPDCGGIGGLDGDGGCIRCGGTGYAD